ncbi:MAG TPA: Fe-S protein assembly co-chaperone HscB, partial [Terriglobales bacterium]|nr:Fe-S protein assembly co-chaperone HscB [Terriglobales bacterium]
MTPAEDAKSDTADYFAFFGLPQKLNLDGLLLEREFYKLSRRLHPDLFVSAGKAKQDWSTEQTSLLNDAYRSLKDPIRRTEHLLHLQGVELEEQSKTATEQARASGNMKKQVVPPDLLEEVFELNMQLEQLRMNKNSGQDDPALRKELEAQRVALEDKHATLLQELRTYWSDWDKLVDRGSEEDRRRVRDGMVDLLNRRNYIRNLVRDVNQVL